jgi:PPOX class probable F420-dependent enzyme
VREMSRDETRAFPAGGHAYRQARHDPRRRAAHVTPIWFVLDGDHVVWTTGETSLKAKAIRRDARVCMCVDDQAPPYSYVMIEGTATLSDDPDALRQWATAIGGRYMGTERAEEFGARNAVPGELLVRITPTRVLARADIAD